MCFIKLNNNAKSLFFEILSFKTVYLITAKQGKFPPNI